jgi:hypothetical protein
MGPVRHVRTILGGGLLLFQLVMIGYARFVPARYFCWAPYDIQTEYRLDVSIDGRMLTSAEIRRRYRRPKQGVDNRSIQHVMDIVQQYEETYGRTDRALVLMKYRVNGKEEREWQYPFNIGSSRP